MRDSLDHLRDMTRPNDVRRSARGNRRVVHTVGVTTPTPDVVALMVRLADALGQAARPSSRDKELHAAVAGIRSLFSAAACSCALVEPGGEGLRFVAAEGAGAREIVGVSLPAGTGIAGWAVMSGQPIVVADVAADSRFARDVAESTRYVPETILAAPLVDEAGDVLGVLEVLDPTSRGEHSGHDLDVLGVAASLVASIVRLSGVYDSLGEVLVGSLVGARTPDEYTATLAQVRASGEDVVDLAALARAFHDLAADGPDGVRLAERVLAEVARFARSRR
jgi:GAF domain-containing protein